MVRLTVHFGFTPRDVDELTVAEFDLYCSAADEIDRQNRKAERAATRTGARPSSPGAVRARR